MVVEKGLPRLRPPSPTSCHVLGDRRLRDLDPKLEQLTVDAWRTPQPVGQAHLPGYPRPTAARARLPAPVQSKPRPMPPDDRLRPDNRDSVQHRRKQAVEPDEK